MFEMNVLDVIKHVLYHFYMKLEVMCKIYLGKHKNEREECLLKFTGAKSRAICALLHCTNPVSTKSHLVDKLSCKLKNIEQKQNECCHGVIVELGRLP